MNTEPAAEHYDTVTDAWMRWIMGDDLHFGLFTAADEPLAQATHNLTVRLAQLADLSPGMSILDVGCGVGTPSIYLAQEHACRPTGISTSRVGVEIARARAAQHGVGDTARFKTRDAMNNGLPDKSFDRVFSLESAHLISDKEGMFRECFRVLKPGGKLALCDVALIGTLETETAYYETLGHSPEVAMRLKAAVHNTMHRAFGSSTLTQKMLYRDAAVAAGFTNVEITDISAQMRRTFEHWGHNAHVNRDRLIERMGERYVEDFFLALLHMSFGWGQLGGYILMSATRPDALPHTAA